MFVIRFKNSEINVEIYFILKDEYYCLNIDCECENEEE